MTPEEKVNRLLEFRDKLETWEKSRAPALRAWLNQNARSVRRIIIEAGCFRTFTVAPPPAVGGLVMRDVDLFVMMFERIYNMRPIPQICDMIDVTVGFLQDPPPEKEQPEIIKSEIQRGFAFVAMPMDRDDHALIDVLEAIKAAGKECGITAERIDDDERSERITDRMLESIKKAEYVIVGSYKRETKRIF